MKILSHSSLSLRIFKSYSYFRLNSLEGLPIRPRPKSHSSLPVPLVGFDRTNINALDAYPTPSKPSRPASQNSNRSSLISVWSSQTAATSQSSSWDTTSQALSYGARGTKRSDSYQGFAARRLPIEVLVCILQHLRAIHEAPNSVSCPSCFNRDAFSLARVSRNWDKAVSKELYRAVYLDGVDSPTQLKKNKLSAGARLKLLRRSLRDRRFLALTVRELRVSNPLPNGTLSDEIIDQVASVVMCCPNLEVLTGIHPVYNHKFSRLCHALASRRKLKQHVWLIGENEIITERSTWQLPPGLMDLEQTSLFLGFHTSWTELTTLVLHAQPGAILEHNIFISIFNLLPSLQHVSISSFDGDDFHDSTLASLRPLKSLRLAYLPGITSRGLWSLASSSQQTSLTSLSLIFVPVTSLITIGKLLHNLPLVRFTLSQPQLPTIPPDAVILPPLFRSRSLVHLHWDIQTPPPLDTATPHLAASIYHGAFPSLRTIRAPSESGTLQSLCAPRAQIMLPSDKFSSLSSPSPGQSHSHSLRLSRLRAQARLEAKRKKVGVRLFVSDEQGRIQQDLAYPGWVGTVGSRIRYVLDSDIGSTERALAEEGDLLGDVWGVGKGGVGGCAGLWNAGHPEGKKWYTHVERGRWRGVAVEKLF